MTQEETSSTTQPRWQPIPAIDRRIVGVLVEKAKTTPEQYPLTLNALRSGCNQKSNRFPVVQLDFDEIEESVDRLRKIGAVTIVHDSGRVPKYRHWMYEWLGVDKVELAIMAELLLRGAQTLGELSALRPVVASLNAKNLLVYLTPEGRGCVVTHNLYLPQELEKLRSQYGAFEAPAAAADFDAEVPASATNRGRPTVSVKGAEPAGEEDALLAEVEELRNEVGELRSQVDELRGDLARLARRVGDDSTSPPDLGETIPMPD
jgi:uncharacterized protein YceH (UPF0502 family)